MPYGSATLNVEKPRPYPTCPRTLGEHLRKRRCERGLLQKDVAAQIGLGVSTIVCWERGRKEPEIRWYPRIIAFLGYDPHPPPVTLSEHLRAKRRALGLSRKALARRLGVDEGTLASVEFGAKQPTRVILDKIMAVLGSSS